MPNLRSIKATIGQTERRQLILEAQPHRRHRHNCLLVFVSDKMVLHRLCQRDNQLRLCARVCVLKNKC